jgi:hypothetical protein
MAIPPATEGELASFLRDEVKRLRELLYILRHDRAEFAADLDAHLAITLLPIVAAAVLRVADRLAPPAPRQRNRKGN